MNLDYDEWYRADHAHWEDAPGKSVLVAALRQLTRATERRELLDVGCGSGRLLERVANEVSADWALSGVDISAVAVDRGRRRLPGAALSCCDATRLPYPDARFDFVTCYGSWEHFTDPSSAVREGARVLGDRGWMLAMLPTLGIYRTDRQDEGWYEDLPVVGCAEKQMQWNFRRATWEAIFADAGIRLAGHDIAARAGALKPGVFYFGQKG